MSKGLERLLADAREGLKGVKPGRGVYRAEREGETFCCLIGAAARCNGEDNEPYAGCWANSHYSLEDGEAIGAIEGWDGRPARPAGAGYLAAYEAARSMAEEYMGERPRTA